ncbi:MAG: hypothetical protein ACYC3L_08925 [Gemmatimonadaceae bacterium]
MISWLIALAAAVGAALWHYGWPVPGDAYRRTLVALRALAVALVVALLLDAPFGLRASARALVALDVSRSWAQGGTAARYAEAVQRAGAAGGDLLLFGDSLRAGSAPGEPTDDASRVGPAVERAAALGRPLTVITDGGLADPEALDHLPAGSKVEVLAGPVAVDAAVRSLELPAAASPGDSVELRALIVTAGAAVPAVTASARLADGSTLAAASLGAMPAWSEREWRVRIKVPDRRDALVVRVVAQAAGDVEHHNDTLSTVLDVRGGPTAVFVSTAPDEDARFALDLMRGAMALAVRGFVRVAPGQWRQVGTLAAVEESVVKDALAHAPVAVLHGDTAYFGAPRALGHGSLLLVAPPRDDDGEYFTERSGASPLAPALSGVPWDSLPPIVLGPAPVGVAWTALTARRGRRFDERVVLAGDDAPRRIAVMPARGLWRWKFRGGRSADAFAALWGGVFDWLAQGDADERPARVASPSLREGDPVTWRHGAGRDSMVTVRLRRDGATMEQTLTLRFPGLVSTAVSAPLAAGLWHATIGNATSTFVVNAGAEWLPVKPVTPRAAVAGVPAAGAPASLRTGWWWWALLLAALSAEWVMRRRVGLR